MALMTLSTTSLPRRSDMSINFSSNTSSSLDFPVCPWTIITASEWLSISALDAVISASFSLASKIAMRSSIALPVIDFPIGCVAAPMMGEVPPIITRPTGVLVGGTVFWGAAA